MRPASVSVLLLLAGCAQPAASSPAPSNPAQAAIHSARDRVYPALVMVSARWDVYKGGARERAGGTGSGTIIDPVGHVLTNYHVAGKADVIHCQLCNKEVVEARLIGADPWTDLALLQLDMDEVRRKAPMASWAVLGHSAEVQVGDLVLAMGAPLGQPRSVSLGVVSNTERVLSESFRLPTGEETGLFNVWLQTDASINPGNSGGPLVDMEGRVIGVNSRVLNNAEGIGFSLPIDIAKDVVYRIMAGGRVRRSWLGLDFQPGRDLEGLAGGDPAGAYVREVEAGSPADAAGVRPQDVLVSLEGSPVPGRYPDEIFDLRRRIASIPVAQEVQAVFRRGGKDLPLSLTTAELGASLGEDRVFPRWGLSVREITDRMGRQMGLEEEGVYVTGVRGPAQRAGLMEKDIIVRVSDIAIESLDALQAEHDRLAGQGRAHAKVQVLRGRVSHFVSLRMDAEASP